MTRDPNILLLASPAEAAKLAQRLGEVRVESDPYALLLAMAESHYDGVVVTAPRPDFESLCRAVHRVKNGARLLAVCSAASEPQVHPLAGELLDDYFIYPPTRDDVAAIRRLCAPAADAQSSTTDAAADTQWVSDLPARQSPDRAIRARAAQEATGLQDFATLLGAATGMVELESALVELLLRRTGIAARWIDAETLPADAQPLLEISGEIPQALVAMGETPPPAAEKLLDSLQLYLPALADNARRIESLHRLAITDHLTGAYNRRYFYHLTEQILLRAAQKKFRVTLLLYDIDDFKHYNETYGHAAGDEILRETAHLMKQTCRSHDVVARIGGDEFAALFWDAQPPRSPDSKPLDNAYALANRFRAAVGRHSFPSLGPEAMGALSISGGLATFPEHGTTCRDLLRAADHALRTAKRQGKNAIRLIGPDIL